MIDVGAAHHNAPLFVDEEEIPVTYAIVECVGPCFEAFFDFSELLAVLKTRRIGRKPRAADLAVVMLQSREIPVRQRNELARDTAPPPSTDCARSGSCLNSFTSPIGVGGPLKLRFVDTMCSISVILPCCTFRRTARNPGVSNCMIAV